jgi:glucokinase
MLQFDLLEYVKQKLNGRVSVERIVSGRGIVVVYEFLWARYKRDHGIESDEDMPPNLLDVHSQVTASDEGGKFIQQNETKDELCQQCITMVLSAYGAETGNLGLKFMPFGGLFVAGGIILKVCAE